MFKKIMLSVFLMMAVLSAAYFEATMIESGENALSTFSSIAQNGTNTYANFSSLSATDTQELTIEYMTNDSKVRAITYNLTGTTVVSTAGSNYQYVISNITNKPISIEISGSQLANFSSKGLNDTSSNASQICTNYTNVYRVDYLLANYTSNMNRTSASALSNSDDGTIATLYSTELTNITFANKTVPTALWYKKTPLLNLSGTVNSTNLVLPSTHNFLSTTAFTISIKGLPGTVTVTPNNNTRTYNLSSNNTLATEVALNNTALAVTTGGNTSILYTTIQPNMKLSTINATLTIVGEINGTGTVVKMGSTTLGNLTANTTIFNVSQALLSASSTLTYSGVVNGTNITTATLVYRNMSNSGWYVIPQANFAQEGRIMVAVADLAKCPNATLFMKTGVNLTTTNYTKTGSDKDTYLDLNYIYNAKLASAAAGNVSITNKFGETVLSIPLGNTTPINNGGSFFCTKSTGCKLNRVIYGGNDSFKMSFKKVSPANVSSTVYTAWTPAATMAEWGSTIVRWAMGERLDLYATPKTNNTVVSIYYEVG